MPSDRLTVREMVKEAVENLPNEIVTYGEVREYIKAKYPSTNERTVNCMLMVCAVNQTCRVCWPENKKARQYDERYDFLYCIDKGKVTLYNPEQHGKWEIIEIVPQEFKIHRLGDNINNQPEDDISDEIAENESSGFAFQFENQLRDFIAQNLSVIDESLSLYVSEEGVGGVEFHTGVGNIDILAQNREGDFVVFELKVSRGPDSTLGQIQRYMGWVKQHLAGGNVVKGIIIAKTITERLRYAISVASNISLFEYQIQFDIKSISSIE